MQVAGIEQLQPRQAAAERRRPWWGRRRYALILVPIVAALIWLGLALRPAAPAHSAIAAPGFTLPILWQGHGSASLAALRGHPVVLAFFRSDCGPCLDGMAALTQTARAYQAQGVRVLAISSLGDQVDAAARLARADRLPFPVLSDAHQSVAWSYGVSAAPTIIFVDAAGHLRGQVVGQIDSPSLRDGLAQAGAIECGSCSPVEPPQLGVPPSGGLRATTVFGAPLHLAPPFALRDQDGRTVSPASFRGKVVALTFLSAVCIEQCPLVGQTLGAARRLLGPDAGRLVIVAVSVAPEQDSAAATRRFASEAGWNGANWHYLSGARAALSRIWNAYGVFVEAPPPIFKTTGASLVHQAGLFLIDLQGRLRAYDEAPFLPSDVAASARTLLSGSVS